MDDRLLTKLGGKRNGHETRLWKVPMEAAVLFAGSRPVPPIISSTLGLFVLRDCTLLYCPLVRITDQN